MTVQTEYDIGDKVTGIDSNGLRKRFTIGQIRVTRWLRDGKEFTLIEYRSAKRDREGHYVHCRWYTEQAVKP